MGTLSVFLTFVLLILSCSSEINCFPNYNCTCKQHERKALLDFKKSFVAVTPGSTPFSSWVGEDCCSNWEGVLCDNVTCNIVSLDTSLSDLRSKVVSPALFELKHLQFLSLSGIDFSGSRIPQSIGSLKNLTGLYLSECNFSGPIPQQFNNLTNLLNLYLYNSFQHGTKVDNLKWLFGLQKIKDLYLNGIDLSQTPYDSLQVFHQLLSLQTLRFTDCKLSRIHFSRFLSNSTFLSLSSISELDFSNNILNGPIPDALANLSTLTQLDLSKNLFSSSIPLAITTLYSLRSLYIGHNRLNGNLPSLIGRLQSLTELDVSNNNLSGVIHEGVFANLSNLNTLFIGSNSLVLELSHNIANNTSFPKWLLSKNFYSLDLSHCGISLPLPQVNEIWPFLYNLNLANNNIYGNLPHSFWNMSSIATLILSNNYISGPVLKSLCNSPSLMIIALQNNKLSGTIPSCLGNISGLGYMDLSSNKLSGFIPSSLWKTSELLLLNLSNNSFQGELPILNTSTSLMILDLSENKLSGSIPRWNREQFSDLQILILRSNHLVGSIPLQVCSLNKSLHILDLANNHLTGIIPQCFDHFNGMKNSSSTFSDLSLFFTWTSPTNEIVKGAIVRYTTNIKLMVNLDLSSNNMFGPIPPNLTNLEGLKSLNLSHNHLTGSIPLKIGQLRSLESLDLSNNCLSGSIPQSISTLNYLEVIHLSYNNLSGPVPTGNQLQTLKDPANYVGNPNLCADFLPRKCITNNHEKKPNHDQGKEHEDDDKHEEMWLYVFISLGIATGFWVVIGILIVKRQWRYAYFQLADQIGDWLYVWTALTMTRLMRNIK